jgi:hypothetical protein
MITRRELLGSGALAPLGPLAAEAQQTGGTDRRVLEEIRDSLGAIGRHLDALATGCSTGTCDVAERIRASMVQFLRAQGKFPDLLEVGPEAFLEIYDWHVRNRQPLQVGRGPDGRYGLTFQFTRLVLRPDAQPGFIGLPYDTRA